MDLRSNNQWKQNAFIFNFPDKACHNLRFHIPDLFRVAFRGTSVRGKCIVPPVRLSPVLPRVEGNFLQIYKCKISLDRVVFDNCFFAIACGEASVSNLSEGVFEKKLELCPVLLEKLSTLEVANNAACCRLLSFHSLLCGVVHSLRNVWGILSLPSSVRNAASLPLVVWLWSYGVGAGPERITQRRAYLTPSCRNYLCMHP